MNKNEFKRYVLGEAHSSYGFNELVVPLPLKRDFGYWFNKNGVFFTIGNSIEEAEFSHYSSLIKPSLIEPGLCYGNSQKIMILNSDYYYYEGFYQVENSDSIKPVSRHGFNLKKFENEILIKDFTSYAGQHKPSHYFGVEIPNNFILEILSKKNIDLKEFLQQRPAYSMIRPYFFRSVGRDDLILNGFFSPE